MLPALMSPRMLLGYGQLLVSFTHIQSWISYEPPPPPPPPRGGNAVNFRLIIGEDRCRLSSDQSILEMPDGTLSLVLTLMSKTVLFGFPDVHRARLEGLWVDQLAYTSPWRKHVSDTVEDLKQKMTWVGSIAVVVATFSHLFLSDLHTPRVR
jgi:hypothetical protein